MTGPMSRGRVQSLNSNYSAFTYLHDNLLMDNSWEPPEGAVFPFAILLMI